MPVYDAKTHAYLMHYGIKRKSGRYPWGSGGKWGSAGDSTSMQRSQSLIEVIADLEAKGHSKKTIAEGFGMTTTQLRDTISIARNDQRREKQLKAEKLREKGMSATEIGRRFDPPLNESSVRQLLNKQAQEKTMILENTMDMLRQEVDKGGWIDIGAGSEFYIPGGGISKEKLRAAVAILRDEGYEVIPVQVDQAGSKTQKTNRKVLCPPGTEYKDVVQSKELIRPITSFTENGGREWTGGRTLPPMMIDSKRVGINYAEDGGHRADGVIYVRPGVKDVNIGGSQYAQVRINVDGTHYLKGMAMYKNDLPDGVDLVFNTNKKKSIIGDNKLKAMKEQEKDPDNPFGAYIARQLTERGPDGKPRLTSVMNILQEEGTWDTWSRNLSSQVLSKQSPKIAERQLAITHSKRQKELNEILALTNPTVRQKLLSTFADSVDSDAVDLSAAGFKRSSYHVILPFNSLKDNEVYAPNFEQGEKVALIRYPHGGTFEIPVLTVNNNAKAPKAAIGRAKDAVGINHKVAERLSGADFDGDFVMVIPNNNGDIKSTPALRQLEGFDPHKYKLPDDAPDMDSRTKQKQMGNVSNLITDMTIKKAPMDEISRAVRHSMVVIDAEKHRLDWKRSEREHGIAALKEKYQGRNPENGQLRGASTLVSRATSQARVPDRKLRYNIDPETGQKIWIETGKTKTRFKTVKDEDGNKVKVPVYEKLPDGSVRLKKDPVLKKSTKLYETEDANTLLSDGGGTLIERVYADHSNRLKAMANYARKEMVTNTEAIPDSPTAKKFYADEVSKLKADLRVAKMNSPRERAAQDLAGAIIRQKQQDNPTMTDDRLKKVSRQALEEARHRVGAKKIPVEITSRQWEAIQAGAVSKTMLKDILDNADLDGIKELATPRPDRKMDDATATRARALAAQGMTQADIARVLGVGLTTLKEGLADG